MTKENKDISKILESASEAGKIERLHSTFDSLHEDNNWTNPGSGFGGAKDPSNKLQLNPFGNDSKAYYEALYQFDWLGKKIINAIPEDALREWIDLKSDNAEFLKTMDKTLTSFDVRKKVRNAFINARLYGGSLIVIGANDGQDDITEPLDEDNIKAIMYLTILDRWQVNVKTVFNDPLKDNFGEPAVYSLRPFNTHAGSGVDTVSLTNLDIHSSRVVRLDGSYVPDNLRSRNNGWGDSELLSVQIALRNYGMSIQSVAVLLQDFITKVLKVENLADLLKNEDSSALEKRLKFAIANQSSLGITLIGENESMEKIQHPVTGLKDLVDKMIETVSAASNIPRARLFGQQLGTLAGASETTDAYFDLIKGIQTDKLESGINRIITLFSKDKSLFKTVEEDWTFSFKPLRQDSNEKKAKINKDQAQSDGLYLDRGVLTLEEVRTNRFAPDGGSLDTVVDPKGNKEFDDLEGDLAKFGTPPSEEGKTDNQDDMSISFSVTIPSEGEVTPCNEEEKEEEVDNHVHEISRGFMTSPLLLENGNHVHKVYREGRLTTKTSEGLLVEGGHIHEMPDGTKTGLQIEGVDRFIRLAEVQDQEEQTSTIQSIIISKETSKTDKEAKAKAEKFGKISMIEDTETSFRFRQSPPEKFKNDSFKAFKPQGTNGITLIIGKLK